MAKFVMVGKYSAEAARKIAGSRTRKVKEAITRAGGKVSIMLALLGCKDILFVVDFPGVTAAMKASIAITRLTGISFTTSPAITVDEFDRIA